MKYRQLGTIMLFFFFCSIGAQELKLCFQTGYGLYNMESLKQITQKAFVRLPFEAKIISNYPPYHYYQPMIKLANKNFEYGLIYLFQTTGSRISSKDYSGEYRFDSKINCNSPGIFLSGYAQINKNIKMGLFLQAGINFSTLKVNEFLQIDTIIGNHDYEFNSHCFFIEPGINLSYSWIHICFEIDFGYCKEFLRNDFSESGESQNRILFKKDYLNFDMWDGMRIGATISYTLFTSKVKQSKNNNEQEAIK
jgi:hypothetical protein